jgi:outer membrane receptor protein involved in Fe transport
MTILMKHAVIWYYLMNYKFYSLFALLMVVTIVNARQDTIPTLKEVVVRTSRMNGNAEKIPFSFSLIDSNSVSSQNGRSIPELMEGIAGVFIQKTNHGGGSPFVRGLTGNQNLVLIDGIRLNNAIFRYGPNQYLTLLDPLSVERIEVVKGTGSVQYGSDALGGVINIITQVPEFSPHKCWSGRTDLRWTSSAMESSFRQQINFSSQRFTWMLAGSNSDFGDLRGGDTTGFQRPSGYLQQSLESKLKWNAGKGWTVTAGFTGVRQRMVPLFHKYRMERFRQNFSNPLERGLLFAHLHKTFQGKELQQINIQLSGQRLNEQRVSEAGTGTSTSFEQDKINNKSIQAEAVWKLSAHWTTRTGIEWTIDQINSSRNQLNTSTGNTTARRGLYPDGAVYQHAAFYNLHQLQTGRWHLEGGWRYHWYDIQIEEASLGRVAVQPSAFVLLGGASYAIHSRLVVFGNLSTGYRAPNIDDMGTLGIIDFRYEVPSYGLLPEKSVNKEIGIRYHKERWSWSGSLFHSSLNNLINRIKTNEVIAGYSVYIKQNNERAYIQGAELETRFQFNRYWSIFGMVTYLYGQNITREEPVRRIPPFNGFLSLQYRSKCFRAGINFEQALSQRRLAQGDKDDNRIPPGGTPGFFVVHGFLGGNWKHLNVRCFLNNLTNADNRKHGSGINGMGRSATLSLQYQF